MKPIFSFLVVCVLLVACKKNDTDLQWKRLHQQPELDFYSLRWQSDSLLVCGNGNESGGVLVFPNFTTDPSPTFFSTDFNVFDCIKLNGTYFIGSDSANFYSTKDFQSFKSVYIDSANWVNYLMQQPLYRLVEIEKGKSFFAAGGGNNGYGVTFYCEPESNKWVSQEYYFGVRSAFLQEQTETIWLVGNGLLGKTSTKELEKQVEQFEFDNKYITDIAFADDNNGVMIAHNGAIYSSNDAGESWKKLKENTTGRFGKNFLNRVKWFPAIGKWVIAGNNGVLLWSDKSASEWNYYKGFDNEHLLDIDISQANEVLIAATGGNLFSVDLP